MFSLLTDKLRSGSTSDASRDATHFYSPTKTYFALESEEEELQFWISYCDVIVSGEIPNLYETLNGERAVQLAFDLSLVFEKSSIDREELDELVDEIDEYIKKVISLIQGTISNYFERTVSSSEYIACYLRRTGEYVLNWSASSVEFSGRIVFPYARVAKELIPGLIRLIRTELHGRESPDDHINAPITNSVSSLIKPVDRLAELYGSASDDTTMPLSVIAMYGYINSTEAPAMFELEEVFKPACHKACSREVISERILQEKIDEHGLDYWLPLFFSNGFSRPVLEVVGENLLIEQEQTTAPAESANSKLEYARQLLGYISDERVDSEWSWLDIGQALYTIDRGEEGLKWWIWKTERSDFKTRDDCRAEWYGFDMADSVNIETLEFFAQEDSPQQYEAFRKIEIEKAINNAIATPENIPVAEAFKACFPHDFVCSSQAQGEWYMFRDHRWIPIDGNANIMRAIIQKFKPKLEEMQFEISGQINTSRDAEFKARQQNRLAMIGKLIKKLCSINYLETVCRAVRLFYHNPDFNSIKDTNPYLLATPTGVIDVRGEKAIVRSGKPQDYITRCSKVGYAHDYDWNNKYVIMVEHYMSQLFRNKNMRDYFWRFLCSLLLACNPNKILPIFSGSGDNSKSALVRLIECAFGNYSIKLPTSLITEKRTGADQATPTLIYSMGAKVGFLEEPNKEEIIRSGTTKQLTGRDTIYARDLFQKAGSIKEILITMVPVLVVNKVPLIPDCQGAMWSRPRVIEFTSRWSKDAPEDPEEQIRLGIFPEDRHFDRNFPHMAPAFLWILVQKYELYHKRGLDDPKEVMEATENLRIMNNTYIHFVKDCLVDTVDPKTGDRDMNSYVELREMFNTFKGWWKGQEMAGKIPTMTDFRQEIETLWKTKADSKQRWFGWRMNIQQMEIETTLSF